MCPLGRLIEAVIQTGVSSTALSMNNAHFLILYITL